MTHARLAAVIVLAAGCVLLAGNRYSSFASRPTEEKKLATLPPVCYGGTHTTMTPACDSVHSPALTNLTGQTATFKVTNTSGSGESYDLSCTYTTPISSCSASTFVDVPASSTRSTTVTFSTGADSGTATLSLRATSSITADDAKQRIKIPVRFDTLKVSSDFTNNDNQNMGMCASACFALTQSVSSVPYYSMGGPRSVSLVYNGDRVALRPFVYADVTPPTGANAPTQYTMRVKVDGAFRKFANGDDSLRFSVPVGAVRLGGQIDSVTDKATGVYPLEIHIKGKYSNHEENKTMVSKLIVVNERTSPIARGWTVAGLPRVYLQADSSLLVTDGTGSAIYFQRSGGTYLIPRGDHSSWSVNWTGVDTMFTRIFPDSTKIRFNNLGRMRSVTDRFGNQTMFE
ncbi:MAG: hypothetical protein ABR543_10770, partial [Gemmatimonadaceae bacterium]